jgi:hypothetical protein
MKNRFDLYGALWLVCTRHHGGQSSRGYRILSRLARVGYEPGLTLQTNRFETLTQKWMYRRLLRYRDRL